MNILYYKKAHKRLKTHTLHSVGVTNRFRLIHLFVFDNLCNFKLKNIYIKKAYKRADVI